MTAMPTTYSPKDYWSGVAAAGTDDVTGFAPILHPDAPPWFNSLIDRLQEREWRRALAWAGAAPGARVLDVGCGTGRWLRRYSRLQFSAAGVDATANMLRRAKELGTGSPLVNGPAQSLPFRDSTFDLVSAVTVVQHIPAAEQPQSLREMARVVRPGGHVFLLELLRGSGPHVFPHRLDEWRAIEEAAGLSLIKYGGQEYLLLDRALVALVRGLRRASGSALRPILPGELPGQIRRSAARRAYWSARRAACTLSEWLEPAARAILPASWATHGIFVFRK